ncbi:hypothetical protein [Burkholderia glumae]|uniref:hypothetical protein n=3 Tax=Burkholderia glumae TaxID=337 RepID=UPI0018AFB9F5|nr:hypothetical protein [Burkholderia glumae]
MNVVSAISLAWGNLRMCNFSTMIAEIVGVIATAGSDAFSVSDKSNDCVEHKIKSVGSYQFRLASIDFDGHRSDVVWRCRA